MALPDPHLPAVHLRPPRNWINDPNGLAYHDGYYHVCFQYNPYGSEHAHMHWGHFRSTDLVHWEPLPIALAPTPGGEDADGCFSGNAVSAGDRLLAFYSAMRQDRWAQPVAMAQSRDGGLTWEKRERLVVPEPPEGVTMYRDPYVWRQDGRWRMLVGAALADGRGAALLYVSGDLETWEYQGPLLARHPEAVTDGLDTCRGWECPQYLHTGDEEGRGLLIISAWDPERGPQHVVAYPGEEEEGEFRPGAPQLLDHGPDFYAPALLPAPDGRWLLWGWCWEAREDTWAHEAGWAGLLTLPREVSIGADGAPVQQPAREVASLRRARALHITSEAHGARPAELGEVSRTFDMTAHLNSPDGHGGALRLVTSDDGSEYLDIRWDPAAGEVVVDREHASRDPRARGGSHRLPAGTGDRIDLRVLVDGSVVELFLGTGRTLTLRFYPTGEAPWRIEARPATPTGRLGFTVEAWDLRQDTIQGETEERAA